MNVLNYTLQEIDDLRAEVARDKAPLINHRIGSCMYTPYDVREREAIMLTYMACGIKASDIIERRRLRQEEFDKR